MPIYDVNTKAAAAMINSGLSASGVQNFIATMEVPPVTGKNFETSREGDKYEGAESGLCYQH